MARTRKSRGQGGGLGAASGPTRSGGSSAGSQRGAAARGGINAKKAAGGARASDAGDARYASGGRAGRDAPAGGAGGPRQQAYGLKPGTNRPIDRNKRSGKPAPASTAAGTSNDTGPASLADHVPAHTFANSTIPRSDRQPGASARRTPSDLDQPKGSAYAEPDADDRTRSMAQGMGFKAAAANAAKSAGVSPAAGAAMVAAASQHAGAKARRANPNLAKVAKPGQHKGPGGKFS